jgi:6-phosphogluconolactonase (cycloisomerase 2 family)
LELIGSPVGSGGTRPISLTVHGDLLYVLNAGGSGNIAGFRIGDDGAPTPIAGSSRPLSSAAAGPAQIQFSPDGRLLVVTEKATNAISTYTVGADGLAGGPNAQTSAGETPFGFNFNQRGDLVVSEAFGGAPGASTASSYRLDRQGNLTLISGPVPTTQTAACWIAIGENGRFAYTTNTGSSTLSSLAIGAGATLMLEEAVAGATGPLPLDAAFTPGGRFLYVRNGGGTVGAFRAKGNGELTHIGDFGSLPAGANGIAAR